MPEALQPLMDEDSPVADVFESCGVCDQLTANNTRVTNVSGFISLCLCMHAKVLGCEYCPCSNSK